MSSEKKEDKKSFDELWSEAKKSPGDFTVWTTLLAYVEHNVLLVGIESCREVFGGFFDHYPYCYGYWKKLADLERKNIQDGEDLALQKCRETFEKGLEAIPLSVDLWIQYLNFTKTQHQDSGDDGEAVRALFEKAISVCGEEFRSDRLWDSFIQWETEKQDLRRVIRIYDKLIAIPTQLYTQHFEKLQGLLEKYPLTETLYEEEIEKLRSEYEEKKGQAETEQDETTYMKEQAIARRKEVHKKNEEACTSRWTFEESIKRPYFHVKPLEKHQIKNWRDYLDFEIDLGDKARTRLLFERCLIACALYEDMWMKYIRWAESAEDSVEDLLALFKRACEVHLPRKPTINLAWLAFVESKEQQKLLPAGSVEILLGSMEERFRNCVAFAMRRINILRRMGRTDSLEELYKQLILNADTVKLASSYAMKYARFIVATNPENQQNAIQILRDASQKDPENVRVYMTMLDLSIKSGDTETAAEIFRNSLRVPEISASKKLEILQRKIEYYEEITCEVDKAQQALEEYSKTVKIVEKEKDRKRPAEENGNGGPDTKKKMDESNQAGYYDKNGQASLAPMYGQQAWGHQGYGQAGFATNQSWNGQQQQHSQSYGSGYSY